MANPPDVDAETLFADWLQAREAGRHSDFDECVAKHPQHAAELRRMHDDWVAFAPLLERVVPGLIASDIVPSPSATRTADPEGAPPVTSDLIERLGIQVPNSGRYRFREVIGRGGGGIVLRVWDQKLHRPLAMKIVLGRGEARPTGDTPPIDAGQMTRFVDEARIASQLDHPGIVPVHELGIDTSGRAFFTMRLVQGDDFGKILARVRPGDDGWSQLRALNVLARVCEAVAYANEKGVVHRDLKPANVMVGKHGEVHVMDWGLARVRRYASNTPRSEAHASGVLTIRSSERDASPESPLLTRDGSVVGTPAYMAPEQARGELDRVDARSDVYAIGAMLYELLTGQPPFVPPGVSLSPFEVVRRVKEGPPEPIEALAPHAPSELVAICEQAMARDPADRYADVRALEGDLRAYLEGRVVAAFETGPWAVARKWIRRNRLLAATAAAGLLAVVGGGGLAMWQASEAAKRSLESRHLGYVATMRSVTTANRVDDHEGAARLLANADEAERHWEWRHLDAVRDTSSVVFRQGTARTDRAHFSPDQTRVVTVADDGVVRIWDAASGRLESSLEIGPVIDAFILGDGEHLAVFYDDQEIPGEVAIYSLPGLQKIRSEAIPGELDTDLDEFRFLHRLAGDRFHIAWTMGLCCCDLSRGSIRWFTDETENRYELSPMGDRGVFMPWSDPGPIRLFAVDTRQTIADLVSHKEFKFTADGSRLLAFGGPSAPQLLSTSDGALLATLALVDASNASMSRDGSRTLLHSETTFWIFDTRDAQPEAGERTALAMHRVHEATVLRRAEISPDGEDLLLVTDPKGSGPRRTIVCSVAEYLREGHFDSCRFDMDETDCSFSANGRWIVDGQRVWDAASGSPIAITEPAGIDNAEFAADRPWMLGTDLATGEARRWDLDPTAFRHVLTTSKLVQVGFSDDGRLCATVVPDPDGVLLQLWDAKRDVEVGHLRLATASDGNLVRFTPDGRLAILASRSGMAFVDTERLAICRTIDEGYELADCAFSQDGTRLVASWWFSPNGDTSVVSLHDMPTGTTMQRHYRPKSNVRRIGFLPKVDSFFASDADSATVWPMQPAAELTHTWSGNAICSPSRAPTLRYGFAREDTSDPGLAAAVEALAERLGAEGLIQNADSSVKPGYGVALCGWSGNRRTVRLFTNRRDRRLEVREGAANRWRCDLVGHRGAILDVAISNDGRRLATASEDRTVRLWDGASGQEVLVLDLKAERLFFSPDDRWLCVFADGGWRMLDSIRHREVLRRRVPAGG